MIQLKDKLKVNGGTRRYMEMIGLSLAFSLFAVSCTQDSDTFYPSSPEEEHPSVDERSILRRGSDAFRRNCCPPGTAFGFYL